MEMHAIVQGTDEWDLFRFRHFGASEAPMMLGISSKATRNELLAAKSLGLAREFSEWVQERILGAGHAAEAAARPLVEKIVGEELFPVVCSDGALSASCDGLTMLGEVAFEHKILNADTVEKINCGAVPL